MQRTGDGVHWPPPSGTAVPTRYTALRVGVAAWAAGARATSRRARVAASARRGPMRLRADSPYFRVRCSGTEVSGRAARPAPSPPLGLYRTSAQPGHSPSLDV